MDAFVYYGMSVGCILFLQLTLPAATASEQSGKIQWFPNPFNTYLNNIILGVKILIALYEGQGQNISTKYEDNDNYFTINIRLLLVFVFIEYY